MVVDSSFAVTVALAGTGLGPLARRSLDAPSLLWSEAASALAQMASRSDITNIDADRALAWLREAPIVPHDSRELIAEALEVARRMGWAKTYDAEYVVLAQRLARPLVTLDSRLRHAASRLVEVIGPEEL